MDFLSTTPMKCTETFRKIPSTVMVGLECGYSGMRLFTEYISTILTCILTIGLLVQWKMMSKLGIIIFIINHLRMRLKDALGVCVVEEVNGL